MHLPSKKPDPRPTSLARRLAGAAALLLAGLPVAALADTPAGAPHDWQIGMQPAASPVQHYIEQLNAAVSVIIVVISVFVGALLAYVLWRYNAKRNPVPGTVSHNSKLEAAWTAIPVVILVAIFIPSLRLVYYEDRTHDADMTLKVTGHQWYWEYTYPDANNLHFTSYGVADEDLKTPEQKALRHLLVDNQVVLPVGKNIRILTTSADVIHSFFIPSLGVQRYAIPGRTIETWVRINAPGDYYGECNQICGMNHSMMPIGVHAVSAADFTQWLADKAKAKSSNAGLGADRHITLASEH
jgi:cytochrome c oxidase subunit 2